MEAGSPRSISSPRVGKRHCFNLLFLKFSLINSVKRVTAWKEREKVYYFMCISWFFSLYVTGKTLYKIHLAFLRTGFQIIFNIRALFLKGKNSNSPRRRYKYTQWNKLTDLQHLSGTKHFHYIANLLWGNRCSIFKAKKPRLRELQQLAPMPSSPLGNQNLNTDFPMPDPWDAPAHPSLKNSYTAWNF